MEEEEKSEIKFDYDKKESLWRKRKIAWFELSENELDEWPKDEVQREDIWYSIAGNSWIHTMCSSNFNKFCNVNWAVVL